MIVQFLVFNFYATRQSYMLSDQTIIYFRGTCEKIYTA